MTTGEPAAHPTRRRTLLWVAAVAVAFAAADTYVVVLALPDMMTSAGLSIDELQRAAPIVSGFLLGYVAMLPLIGRIADLRGRVPVLVGSLVVFALGSLVTAAAYDLPSMVAGRFLQGVGGGGLVPATLALVADLYPAQRRGVPLGIVSAVQELGSVLGPLYGALLLAVGDWRLIFWVNLVVGAVLAVAMAAAGERPASPALKDRLGLLLVTVALACLLLVMWQPEELVTDVALGLPFVPLVGESRWASPLALLIPALVLVLLVRGRRGRSALVPWAQWRRVAAEADLPGSLLLAVALGGIVLAFATADPKVEVFSRLGLWFLAGTALATVGYVVHHRRARAPLIPRDALTATPAWGALLVSFFIGAALIAALVDIPIFARVTAYPDSQLQAALVLVRFLVALPVGAVVGGWLIQRWSTGVVTALGGVAAAAGFALMSRWGVDALDSVVASSGPLLLAGLGFGLALAPVNAALLASTADAVHGVASAFVVVARMVGMLVGISALTTIGLRRYYATLGDIPEPLEVCRTSTRCAAYSDILREAGLVQIHAVFAGAAVCALLAAVAALVLFRGAQTR